MKNARILAVIVCMMAAVNFASADIIRGIDIDFVTIGNADNAEDTGGTAGCGAVDHEYRIGKYEVTNAQWNAFTAATGAPMGNDGLYAPGDAYRYSAQTTDAQQPTNNVSWYEAAQFCNYLTSGDKSSGVYQFSGNNTNPGYFLRISRMAAQASYGTTYFLPNENEWYKAAYYKPDGSGYSQFANGQDTVPDADNGWNYLGGVYSEPWNVGTGTQEQNGTFDMMGNVSEWNETLISVNSRGLRGGCYASENNSYFQSYARGSYGPANEGGYMGFRVASVPEPATLLLLGLGGLALLRKQR